MLNVAKIHPNPNWVDKQSRKMTQLTPKDRPEQYQRIRLVFISRKLAESSRRVCLWSKHLLPKIKTAGVPSKPCCFHHYVTFPIRQCITQFMLKNIAFPNVSMSWSEFSVEFTNSGYPTSVNIVNTPSGSSENNQNNNSWCPSVATNYWLIHKGVLLFSVR
jgi:hypothetical protein